MDFFESVILGVIQGITEFVPVSSSGHLVFLRSVFKISDTGLFFDVILHGGSLLAIIIFFWPTWRRILKSIFVKRKENSLKLFWNLIIASIPAFTAGFLLEDLVDKYFRTNFWVALFLILTGLIFLVVEKIARPQKKVAGLSFAAALFIGFFQAVAVFPGISRAGLTICGGLIAGLKRKSATYFAFLLTLPVILGANFFEIFKATKTGFNESLLVLGIGFLVSFIFSYLAIKYFLEFVKKYSLSVFAPYLVIVGLLLLVFS